MPNSSTAALLSRSLAPAAAFLFAAGCGTDGVPPPSAALLAPDTTGNGAPATLAPDTASVTAGKSAAKPAPPARRPRGEFFSLEWRDADGYVVRPGHTLSGRRLGTHAMRTEALQRLTEARRHQIDRSATAALRAYEFLAHEHAGSDIAAEALFQQGLILASRSELREAVEAFDHLTRAFPDFDRFDIALAWQYQIALAAKNGHRPYLWGVVPWFKDPIAALDWFEKVNRNAPYGPVAAQALYDKGTLALDNDQTDTALDAFDRVIWDYPDSPLVPESWLALARTREAAITGHAMEPPPPATKDAANAAQSGTGVSPVSPPATATDATTAANTTTTTPASAAPPAQRSAAAAAPPPTADNASESLDSRKITGHEWDQGATRDALAYYNEFIRRYPSHPQVTYAVRAAARMREILARNRYDLGRFYYEERNNPRAAALFFHEAINIAPDSVVARAAEKFIADILAGARAPAGTMDWLFGRYPQYKDTNYRVPPPAPDTATLGFRPGA